jgi:3-oxoacyl-[acyl-carrier-protein] synthase II
MQGRRVVITGCGLVSAAGTELSAFWQSLMAGTCFIRQLPDPSFTGLSAAMGAEVTLAREQLPACADPAGDLKRARCAAFSLLAARNAWADAGLAAANLPSLELERAGVVIGTTLGEERQVGDLSQRWAAQGLEAIDETFLARIDNFRLAALVAAELGLGGSVMLNATACSSGNAATAWAYDLVASGAAELMLAGGADTLTRVTYSGFSRMSALSKGICRPFDRQRDGVSFGEGAGVLVLEELEHARARGARIYAELAGYGVSNDAYHLTAPEQSGEGFARAMRQALATTGTDPEQVDYISAHGTGTPYNDLGETSAVKAVLGERASRVPMSSIKSMLGHTNGAASAIESIACTLALVRQQLPPTANLQEPDPAFGPFDFVPGRGRDARVGTCLNLSAGFGGFNVCVVLKEAGRDA